MDAEVLPRPITLEQGKPLDLVQLAGRVDSFEEIFGQDKQKILSLL